ncbi:N-acetylmuramoyl-L-alanine amidase [Streptomyces sp. DH12]|uniref:peptidoglycan recognition protein family protein n=1 Tax=Streptomyces sp. DH12 TaxID=2857010 RepID=UPI001E5C7003|nr:N-acetylmuramoyl-L-alanine amidase [Streptomyces sp. DH12]
MAWYPAATKLELQPESDGQPAIRPTQFILHSVAAPWTARRMYEYWRDAVALESHFGLGFEGDLAQYIGTETRADANYRANRRPDGTGAVSIETASNKQHTDPWTDQQIEQLIRVGVWLHQRHGIPLRKCRTADDPGYGYHRLHAAWSSGGTACPGDARVKQFEKVVFPQIVARAKGQTTPPPKEEDMPLSDADIERVAKQTALATLGYRNEVMNARSLEETGRPIPDVYAMQSRTYEGMQAMRTQLAAQSAAIQSLAAQLGDNADTDTVVAAVERAIRDAVVHVSVDVTGPTKEA